jgi:hypothetical protein
MALSLAAEGLQIWKAYANAESRINADDKEGRYTERLLFLSANKLSYCEMMWQHILF